MPCRDYYSPPVVDRNSELLKAGMCALLGHLESVGSLRQVLDACDWKEAGVTKKEMMTWWKRHKQADKARREREQVKTRMQELRKSAITKLTEDECRALGLTNIE